jgi:putative ABC transport system substrate-binding protein
VHTATFDAFREGLRDLGYVEGQNIAIEYRDAAGDAERLPSLAADLVRLPVEAIVSNNVRALVAASQVTSAIPIVAAGGDIVGAGLVANLARPEGNITGVSTNSVATVGKWVELLTETARPLSRLGGIVDLSNVTSQAFLQQLQAAAEFLHLLLTTYDLRDLDQLSAVLTTARAAGADGLVVVSGGALGGATDPRVGGAVLQARVPAVAEAREFAVNGGLLAYGPNLLALAKRAATYVDKIIKGAKPGDLPVEQPTIFELVVSLKAAQVLGLTIPASVLKQATEIIQ